MLSQEIRNLVACVALLMPCICNTTLAAEAAPAVSAQNVDRVMPLEVTVNGSKSGTWLLLEHAGALFAPRDAFEEWRVMLDSNVQGMRHKEEEYFPLSAVPGYKSKVDFANQSVELLFSPQAFAATRLGQPKVKRETTSDVLPSVFFNYDINYQQTEYKDAPGLDDLGTITEIGFSSRLGLLTNSMVGRNLLGDSSIGIPRKLIRLETTFTRDFSDKNITMRLGDTSTRAGMQGLSIYFGGMQVGTNFALTPGYISQPVPLLTGLSAVPSTVDLYVNDVLRQTSEIPTGPFAIDNFPALNEGGEARLVVRDLLGRETVITQSFFTSNKLLAAGLDDWSVAAGSVRRDMGITSASYGPGFARGLWRHGYSDSLTLEGLGEIGIGKTNVGIGAVTALPGQWLGSAAFASSHKSDLGNGSQWLLGLERQGLRNSIFLQAQGASVDYRQLGQEDDIKPLQQQIAANWTYSSDYYGSFGLGFVTSKTYEQGRINTMTANYSVQVGRGSLNLTASRSTGEFEGSSIGLNLVLPLDSRRVASASATSTGNQNDFYVAMSENPVLDGNVGWRALAGVQQNHQHDEAGLYYLSRHGALTADASYSTQQSALRVGANGGLVMADGHLFATQRQSESFALAEVEGYGNVGVGLGNNMLTRTDASGVALVPQLVPYQVNSVRLDPNDLPVSAELDSIEQGTVPPWRSVVKVKFPVRSGRGALLKIRLDDGDVAPAGAVVWIEGDPQEFYVARRGEAFVTGLQPDSRVRLKWKGRQCAFDVALPPESRDEIPRVGPLACEGVVR